LYYHGVRYYACWLARWTSADPLGIGADGPGLYSYVRGGPINLVDPNGKEPLSAEQLQRLGAPSLWAPGPIHLQSSEIESPEEMLISATKEAVRQERLTQRAKESAEKLDLRYLEGGLAARTGREVLAHGLQALGWML